MPTAMGTVGKATSAGNHASPLSEPGTRITNANPVTTAITRKPIEAAIQRSCWRSVPLERRRRTNREAAAGSVRIRSGNPTVSGETTRQIARSGKKAIGLRTGTLVG